MATPDWLAASTGQQSNAGMVTQFMGTHSSQWVYPGVLQNQQATGSATYQSLASGYLAQQITTGSTQTTIGQVALQISTVGGSPTTATISPLAVSLYASSSGLPIGSALASATLLEPYVYSQPFWVSVPLLAANLAPSAVYCLVVTGPAIGSGYYVWQQSNQTQGAATSPDGATWTAQPYGLMYQVYDSSAGGQIQALVDDDGARVTTFTWSGSTLVGITEFTQAQSGSLVSTRTLMYSNGLLVGVS